MNEKYIKFNERELLILLSILQTVDTEDFPDYEKVEKEMKEKVATAIFGKHAKYILELGDRIIKDLRGGEKNG